MKTAIVMQTKSLNIGDDIQALAAYKLIPKVDLVLDREHLNQITTKEEIRLLCNGWFMENPQNWPPAENINPLFISIHITHNNRADKYLLDNKWFDYYKKFEPIGCRDYHTVRLFNQLGIEAYYSGCITLTLENGFSHEGRTDEILFVDAFNKNLPKGLREKYFDQLVPDIVKSRVNFISHTHNKPEMTVEQKFRNAEILLQRYAKAHLVVTSRIHCALPCVALGTPVLFLDVGFNTYNSRNRFEGILNYFDVLNNEHFHYSGKNFLSAVYKRLKLYNFHYKKSEIFYDWETPVSKNNEISNVAGNIKNKVAAFFLNNYLK